MTLYVVKRLVAIIITLFMIITLTFFLMHSIPGGPFTGDKNVPEAVAKALSEKYHLDDPLWKQYFDYLKSVAQFDLGPSFKYEGMTVNELIKAGLPVSAKVGLLSVALILIVGIPIGIFAALNQNKWPDTLVMLLATLGVTIPSFVIGTLLLYVFSLKLGWTPAYGVEQWQGYILPVLALSGFSLSFVSRLTRSSMIEVFQQDYMRTARGKGLRPSKIIIKHGLRNGLIPVVTIVGPLIAAMLTGSFVIEKIFALPGIGRHFVQSITNRDYTTIMGITIFYAVILVVIVFIVDLIYGLIDPRIKLNK
ncbi:ABC transporter permease [Sporosarcina limicola]|uniref:Oligopeptide transport system permease protein n=1 Tax=Sporosarcina limicola TaxID=34101 RepID=A0A927MEG4_9BACL|nr:ABC transporter permease [Sporosarcina limicola]MBE1552970.1 oligopeptide transport system permease protein [Sporosarcina limicola]